MAGSLPPDEGASVIRITTFQARPGQLDGLLDAARANAAAAREADGCRSAQVCTSPEDPDAVLVVSRWGSWADLQAFLDWHGSQAHGAVSPYAARPPHAVHYRVVDE